MTRREKAFIWLNCTDEGEGRQRHGLYLTSFNGLSKFKVTSTLGSVKDRDVEVKHMNIIFLKTTSVLSCIYCRRDTDVFY